MRRGTCDLRLHGTCYAAAGITHHLFVLCFVLSPAVTADSRNEFQRVWDFTDKTRTPQEVFEAAERRRRERKGEATSQEDKGGQGRANSPDWWPFK